MESETSLKLCVKRAQQDYLKLATYKPSLKNQAILAIAEGLEESLDQILEANTLDLLEAREMAVQNLIIKWLKLTPKRLERTIAIIKTISKLTDPLARQVNHSYQYYSTYEGYCRSVPLGVIAFIFEGFPELAAIAAAMSLKSGNSIILRGMGESSHVNKVILSVIEKALAMVELPPNCVQQLSSDQGTSLQELLTQNDYIQLAIPYGRPSLVKKVKELASVPTITSVMSNCYLYYSNSGDIDLAYQVIVDSHHSSPDPVNAIEKVVIESNYKSFALVKLWKKLQEAGFELGGDAELTQEFPEYLNPFEEKNWGQAHFEKLIVFKKVADIIEGTDFINRYSSGHADCIISDSYTETRYFTKEVNSIFTYINRSPKFSRLSPQENAVYLAIANQKYGHRGLISLESLTTIKQVLESRNL